MSSALQSAVYHDFKETGKNTLNKTHFIPKWSESPSGIEGQGIVTNKFTIALITMVSK